MGNQCITADTPRYRTSAPTKQPKPHTLVEFSSSKNVYLIKARQNEPILAAGKAVDDFDAVDDDAFGFSPLCWAAWYGNIGNTVALLQLGADPNISDRDGWTPAHFAASKGHVRVLRELWRGGTDFNGETHTTHQTVLTKAFKAASNWVPPPVDPSAVQGGCLHDEVLECVLHLTWTGASFNPGQIAPAERRALKARMRASQETSTWGAWAPGTHMAHPKVLREVAVALHLCRTRGPLCLPDEILQLILQMTLPNSVGFLEAVLELE